GLKPTLGFYFWWDDALASGNQVRASGSFGSGTNSATPLDRYNPPDSRWQIAGGRAPSPHDEAGVFGTRPLPPLEPSGRHQDHAIEASLGATARLGGLSSVHVEAGVREIELHDGHCCGDPSVSEAAAMGLFALPPGFADGELFGYFTRARLVLDGRAEA